MGIFSSIKNSITRTYLSIRRTADQTFKKIVRSTRDFARDTYISLSHMEEDIDNDITVLSAGMERWDKTKLKLKEEIEIEIPYTA